MTAIRSLLAATDFSAGADRAVRRAALLAGALGARLELLHVVDDSPFSGIGSLASLDKIRGRLLEEARRKMEVAASAMPQAVAHVETGPLPERIVEAAAAHDLLVLGAQGASSAAGEPVLGTTAGRLLLGAKCAILVVRNEPREGYARVLVPCEFAPPARRALELALTIAPGARITLLHVSEALDAFRVWATQPDETAALRAEVETRALNWLSGLTAGLQRVGSVESRVEFGGARRMILAAARDEASDLIVMGKQGRSRIREMFVGSTTRDALDHAKCDVVIAASS